ncbi:methionine ABC transporter substrate-binding protein [Virgibacillus phasianinus]|uniref:Lipoprotein n=1 Tax=Virgibacillus phasianinus TaxID=2017483 RepID=A0A220U4H3_9BACI|nr:MetQ/NlpA family ABC transporter substrate-binding protein [Virgibacillus phasianinus]ASK62816.1 methionine ABC transporter substrate-binding protein [Virgibacillus phasianinus]
MKKILAVVSLLFIFTLAACGGDEGNGKVSNSEITVGASSTPHAQILEKAKPILEEKGITLTIEEYQDYVLPNQDLESGEIDANYFQHIPYLKQQKEELGYDFTAIGRIHIEPMGIYSKTIDSVESIPDGTEVIMSRSVADHGRILSLLENNGLIKLDDDVNKVEATVDDIVKNPKNLTFSADIDAALLPDMYESEENALVAINTNYAIGADLNPSEDALILEGDESPYVNVIAVRTENKDNKALNTLVDVLHSDEIQTFIKEEFDGAIVPVDGKKSNDE